MGRHREAGPRRGGAQDPQEGRGPRELGETKDGREGTRHVREQETQSQVLPGLCVFQDSHFGSSGRISWLEMAGEWQAPGEWGAASALTQKAPKDQELPAHWVAEWDGPNNGGGDCWLWSSRSFTSPSQLQNGMERHGRNIWPVLDVQGQQIPNLTIRKWISEIQ